MDLDLQGSGRDVGVAHHVEDQLAVEVADADAPAQAVPDEAFHGGPGLLDGRLAGPGGGFGRVSDGRVDVFERDGEVDEVEVEVVDGPVSELAFADRADALGVVEGVPELGDEEEVGAGDEAVVYGAGDAEADFVFVAVVWGIFENVRKLGGGGGGAFKKRSSVPHAPSSKR